LYAATAYDNQFASKKPKMNVFIHSTDDYDDDIHYDGISYNIDAPVSTWLANSTERRNKSNIKNGVRMQRNKWFNLDTKSKEIWGHLDDKAKSIILGYDTRGSSSSFAPSKGISKTICFPNKKTTSMTCLHIIYLRFMLLRLTIQHQKKKKWMMHMITQLRHHLLLPQMMMIPGLFKLPLLPEIVNFRQVTFVVSFQKPQKDVSTNVNI
jgi:hypothetical protein